MRRPRPRTGTATKARMKHGDPRERRFRLRCAVRAIVLGVDGPSGRAVPHVLRAVSTERAGIVGNSLDGPLVGRVRAAGLAVGRWDRGLGRAGCAGRATRAAYPDDPGRDRRVPGPAARSASMSDLPDLIPLDEARRRVLDGIEALPSVTVDLADAVGLALAEPVRSALTLPPWPNSAMDGFAVRAADVAGATADRPVVLRVLGEVPAGRAPDDEVGPGTALRIMTGAMMPAGADTVIPVEDTDAPAGASEVPAAVAIRAPTRSGGNVRLAGSDVAAGTPLLERGRVLDPAAIALLAATGHAAVVGPPPAAGRGDLDRRRAGPARPAPGARADPRVQLVHAGRAGRGSGRRGAPDGDRRRHPAGPARAPPRGGRLGGRRGPQRWRQRRRPRPRQGRVLGHRPAGRVAGGDQAGAPVRLRDGRRWTAGPPTCSGCPATP